MTYVRRQPSSPSGGRIVDPMRSSTGNIPAVSTTDSYHSPTSRPRDGYSPARAGRDNTVEITKPTRYWEAAGLRQTSSRLDAQPISTKTYRDAGNNTKSTTEYAIRPRSRTVAARRPLSVVVPPSTSRQSPIVESDHERTRSPLPKSYYYPSEDNTPYIYPATSSRGRYHYRPSDESDFGRQAPSDKESRARMERGKYRNSGTGGYPASGSLVKYREEDFDHPDAYSYTNPREQFDRDSAAGQQFLHANYSRRERPRSMTGLDGYRPQLELRREPRVSGPLPSTPSRRAERLRPEDGYRSSGREVWSSQQTPVSLHRFGDDGYSSYQEDYGDSRNSRRSRRYEDPDIRGRPQAVGSHGDRNYAVDSSRRTTEDATSVVETTTIYPRDLRPRDHDYHKASDRRTPRENDDEYASNHGDEKSGGRGVDEAAIRGHRKESRRRRNHSDSDADGYTTDEGRPRFLRPPGRRPGPDSPTDKHKQRDEPRRDHSRGPDVDDSDSRRPTRRSRNESTDDEEYISDSRREAHDDPHRRSQTSERPSSRDPDTPPKGILKRPREKFPEDKNAVREGVAPLKDATKTGIPPGARWTKIDRKMVNPAALEARQERFEERLDYVIVLRVLTREEIQELAEDTQKIRGISFHCRSSC